MEEGRKREIIEICPWSFQLRRTIFFMGLLTLHNYIYCDNIPRTLQIKIIVLFFAMPTALNSNPFEKRIIASNQLVSTYCYLCCCLCVFASRLNPLWPVRVISISMIFQRNWYNSYRFPSTFFLIIFLCSLRLSITLFCTILYSFSFSLFIFLSFVVQDVLNESSMLTSIRTKFTGMQDTDKDSNGLSFIPLLTNSSCFCCCCW